MKTKRFKYFKISIFGHEIASPFENRSIKNFVYLHYDLVYWIYALFPNQRVIISQGKFPHLTQQPTICYMSESLMTKFRKRNDKPN